jgi:preprotein translocase subunit YajC
MSPTAIILQDPNSSTPAPGGEDAPSGLFGGGLGSFFPIIAIFAIFYFVMIGPERKNRKKREGMLAALKKGDKVMTNGGMYATVAAVQDDRVTLQIADGVRVRYSVASIQTVETDEAPAELKK